MENVIIVGSGPAGHTAGIYAGRSLLEPLMFEGLNAGGLPAGGQLKTTTDVENYPGFPDGIQGPELMDYMREQSKNCGTKISTKTVDSVDLGSYPFKVFVGEETYETKSLIISTGATAKTLGVPGEEEFWQKGISTCATCDGGLPIFRNKVLGVVGGGDVAMEETLHLTKYASKILLFVRRDQLRASKILQEKIFNNDKVEIYWNTEVVEVKGDNIIKQVKFINNKDNTYFDMDIGGLFYAIGHLPNTGFLKGQLDMDETGYIKTVPGTAKTSLEGVFAAGDVQDKIYRQAVTSAGTGCMAAMEAEWFLSGL